MTGSEGGAGQALFEFVRHWSRRVKAGDPTTAANGRLVLVVEAVATLTRRGTPATVSAVGDEIGVDQSGASRLIAAAVERGMLSTGATSVDRRRRTASVTSAGTELLADAHALQERVFLELTAGWPTSRRRAFHRSMADLVRRSHTFDAGCGDGQHLTEPRSRRQP